LRGRDRRRAIVSSCPPFPTSSTPLAAAPYSYASVTVGSVTLAVRHQRPDDPGGLVRQGNRDDLLRAPGKQLDEPRALSTVSLDVADHGHGADYQHLAQITVVRPRDAAEPLLPTARVLLGYEPDPCCHVPTALEDGGIGDAGDERAGEQRADPWYLHQAATYLSFPRACRMQRSFSRICSFTQRAVPRASPGRHAHRPECANPRDQR
jgi:hypothetical protein